MARRRRRRKRGTFLFSSGDKECSKGVYIVYNRSPTTCLLCPCVCRGNRRKEEEQANGKRWSFQNFPFIGTLEWKKRNRQKQTTANEGRLLLAKRERSFPSLFFFPRSSATTATGLCSLSRGIKKFYSHRSIYPNRKPIIEGLFPNRRIGFKGD